MRSSTSFRFGKFQWKAVTTVSFCLNFLSIAMQLRSLLFFMVINCSLGKRIWISWEWIQYNLLRFHLMGIVGLWQKKHDSCKHISSFLLSFLYISCVIWCTFFDLFYLVPIFIYLSKKKIWVGALPDIGSPPTKGVKIKEWVTAIV